MDFFSSPTSAAMTGQESGQDDPPWHPLSGCAAFSLAVLLSLWQRFSLSLCQRLSLSLSLSPCARALSPPCPSFVWQCLRELRLPAHFAGSCSGFPGHGACSIFYNLLSPSSLTPTGQGFLPHELAPPARSLRHAALGHSASTTSTPIIPGHASPSL